MSQKDDRDCSFVQRHESLLKNIYLVAATAIVVFAFWYFLP